MKILYLFPVVLVICFCPPAGADFLSLNWIGAESSSWTAAANWDAAYTPDEWNYPIIDVAPYDPVISTDVADVYKGVWVGNHFSAACGITITSGGHLRLYQSPDDGYLTLGETPGTHGWCTMTGGQITGHRIVVGNAGYGEFTLVNGTINLTHSFRIGQAIGHQGGLFDMSGGTLNVDYLTVGHSLGIPVDGAVSGGTINVKEALEVGRRGKATLTVSGGTVTAPRIRIGYNTEAAGPQGILNITDGVVVADTYCAVGFYPTDKPCELNVSGGTLYAQDLTIGWRGEGRINLTGGTIIVNEAYTGGLVRFGGGSNPTGKGGTMNLAGGELKFRGTGTSMFQESIDAGHIVAYGGSGRVLNAYDSGTGYTIIKADPTIAHSPVPASGATAVNPALTQLQWVNPFAGQTVNCDVYWGTDPYLVGAQKIVDAQAVNSAAITVNPLGTYYWRVDTYNPVTSAISTGVIWSFTVNDMGAQNPQPEHYAAEILTSQVLSWSMAGDFDTVKVFTCEGANPDNLTLKSSQAASNTQYVMPLSYNKTYLWRVDSVKAGVETTGTVWRFSTANPQCLTTAAAGDLNGDCRVDLLDFAIMAAHWMTCNWDHQDYCGME